MSEEKKDQRRAFLALNVGDQGAVMRTYDEVVRELQVARDSIDQAVRTRPIPADVRSAILMARDAEWMTAMKGGSTAKWEAYLERGGLLHRANMEVIFNAAVDEALPAMPKNPPISNARERLVNFLYLMLRDELAAGVIESVAHRTEAIPADVCVKYSNPHLEAYARELASRLVP